MSRVLFTSVGATLLATALGMPALAQQQQRPQQEATKVEGTDNVYIFRNGNHQAMFIVTKDGVIATDPVAYGKPQGGQQYVDAIKKVSDKPIKYLIYSHHHNDHIAGGKAFKDAGAKVIAHKNATARLNVLKDPNIVSPDESVSNRGRTIKLGGTTLELEICRPQSLGLDTGDAPAEGKDHLRGRSAAGRPDARARHDRLLSARSRGTRSRRSWRWTGSG